MSGRIVAFASAKGGSGKSVTCLAYAQVLAALQKTVVIVDLDVETTGMTLLHIDAVLRTKRELRSPDVPRGGMFEFDSPSTFLVELDGGIMLAPAQSSLAPPPAATDFEFLANALGNFCSTFDYVFLDLQAGADPVSVWAARTADDVVIVAEFDPVSVQGVRRLERLHPDAFAASDTWVLYNKVLPEIAERMTDILRIERKLPPIPWLAEVVRNYVDGVSSVKMSRPNVYTLAIVDGLGVLLGGEIRDSISEWRKQSEARQREPIRSRLSRIEHDLDSLERNRIELQTRMEAARRRRSSRATYVVALVLLLSGAATTFLLVNRTTNSFSNGWSLAVVSIAPGLVLVTLTAIRRPLQSYVYTMIASVANFFGLESLTEEFQAKANHFYQDTSDDVVALRRLEREIASLEQERAELAVSARRPLR